MKVASASSCVPGGPTKPVAGPGAPGAKMALLGGPL